MSKLKNVLTRRILKMLDDEAKKDQEKYNKWYNEFNSFLKEGLTMDHENSEQIFKLLRFNCSDSGSKLISLDDYIGKMKPTQGNIYFFVSDTLDAA